LVLALVGLIGVGKQEAFQLLWNASGLFYALTYCVLFAIPIFGLRNASTRPPLWLRLCAACGLTMTLLFVALSIVPIIEVENKYIFALKICALIVVANLIGLGIFVLAKKHSQA
jgi:hypothetical protein